MGRGISALVSAGALAIVPLTVMSWPSPAGAVAAPVGVAAVVETDPVTHSGDAMDDPAIWVHPTDPQQSLVIGNDKKGSLDSYGLDGHLVQRIPEVDPVPDDQIPGWGNVDVRQGVTVDGTRRDVVAAANASGFQLLEVDPVTRQLSTVSDGGAIGAYGEGLCMYADAAAGRLYVFTITIQGRLRQFDLVDTDADRLLEARQVRDISVGSEAEGCVVDDETGALYVSEENVGLWRYDADPATGATRLPVDLLSDPGTALTADVEGVTVVSGPGGAGYVIVSAQHAFGSDSYFAVYERLGGNRFVKNVRVTDGAAADDCDHTDGITATTADLGSPFEGGMFVCQDDKNDLPGSAGNQNLKLVPLEAMVSMVAPENVTPQALPEISCVELACRFDASGSSDVDGVVAGYQWDFGDGSAPASGATVDHSFPAGGEYRVRLIVTDDDGATDTTYRTVGVTVPSLRAGFVGAAAVNRNATAWQVEVPSDARSGDGLLLFFSRSYEVPETLTGPGADWTRLTTVVDGTTATTVWQKLATSDDAGSSLQVSVEGGYRKAALTVAAYRGVAQEIPFASGTGRAIPGTASVHTTPTVDATTDAWRVSYWSDKSSNVTGWTAPAGETLRSTTAGAGGGRASSLLTDSGTPVAAGAQGGLTAVTDVATSRSTAWTLLLRAASTEPPANTPPTAVLHSSCTGLTCTFDASGSSDIDGSVTDHQWVFGDGTAPGAGATVQHTFAAAGSYEVQVAVTDDDGATGTATRTVTVSDTTQPIQVVAADSATGNRTNHRVTVPASVQPGDLLALFFVANRADVTYTGPTGWTEIQRQTGDGMAGRLYVRTATEADAGRPVSVLSSDYAKDVVTVVAYRNVDAGSPVTASASTLETATSAVHVTPAVTAPDDDDWLVSYWADKSSTTSSWSKPDGQTLRSTLTGAGGGHISALLTDSAGAVASGAQGGLTATANSSAGAAITFSLLLDAR